MLRNLFGAGLSLQTRRAAYSGLITIRCFASSSSQVTLRPYQEACIQAVLDNLALGKKRLGISLATGSGKTVSLSFNDILTRNELIEQQVIFTHLIDRIPARSPIATQTIILVHRRELVEQAARHCQGLYPQQSIEVEMGNIHASGNADITIASVLSLVAPDRLAKFRPERFKLILVDEAHHIVASSYLKVLEHFGLRERSDNSPALVGVSATMSRFDGLSLEAALDEIVFHMYVSVSTMSLTNAFNRDYVDMIEENWLSDVLFTTVQTKIDFKRVRSAASGDFLASSLSKEVNTRPTNELIVKAWKDKAASRLSTLGFCVDVAHVKALTEVFREHGIDARYIVGSDLIRHRDTTLDAFRRGEFPVLLNCSIFVEGTDIPNIDCVLLVRPTKSRNLLIQMIGRGMRLHKGKDNCHVIDMVSSLDAGLVCTPTLFGLNPEEILDEADMEQINKIKEKRAAEAQSSMLQSTSTPTTNPFQTNQYTDYNSVHDFLKDVSGEYHIRQISILAWVQVSDDRHVLMNEDGGYLTIQKIDEADFRVRLTVKLPFVPTKSKGTWKPLLRPRELAKADSMLNAVHAADTYANEHFVRRIVARNKSWRKDPATEGQLAFLNKFRDPEEPLDGSDVTKGQAGDMITKIKFGAKGRFDKMKAGSKQAKRKEQKDEEMRQREKVQVGAIS